MKRGKKSSIVPQVRPSLLSTRTTRRSVRIVGAVGSGKTTAAVLEVGYLPPALDSTLTYNITKTRWCVVRKTVERLMDTEPVRVYSVVPVHEWHAQKKVMIIRHPATDNCPSLEVEVYFRSCDNPHDVGQVPFA